MTKHSVLISLVAVESHLHSSMSLFGGAVCVCGGGGGGRAGVQKKKAEETNPGIGPQSILLPSSVVISVVYLKYYTYI